MKKIPGIENVDVLPMMDMTMEEVDVLYESNLIENEPSEEALEDAIAAWRFARDNMEKIDLAYILEIHRLLMQRLYPEIAGKLRDCDVWIGGRCKMFISEALLKDQLEQWLRTARDGIDFVVGPPALSVEAAETLAKKLHIEFENIHPHVDGNGRTGRILYQIHRLLLGLPLKVIEAKTKHEFYYPWFK
jgi:fido (protein-threonine AMPylation protein)